jgi:leucyl/phenylalanyl-tRNA--protein transferase
MFSRRPDASKFALIALVARLRKGGFQLLDTQFVTEHLSHFGAVEIPREVYRSRLERAIAAQADFRALPLDSSRQELLQLCTHTS